MRNCFIMGSGRSGTSMLAGTLFKAGYYMGDDLYPPRESNPKGFFENAFINGINEKILIETRKKNKNITFPHPPLNKGQMWLEILPLNIKLYSSPSISKLIKKALSHTPFCYKDPRFSYTFPIWEKQLKEETINLIIFRHPAITAESIIKECKRMEYLKDVKMNFRRAINIWESIYLHILKNFNNRKNWIFIHYDQLFEKSKLYELENILKTKINKNFPDIKLKRTVSRKKVPKRITDIYKHLCSLANFNIETKKSVQINKNTTFDKEYYIRMDIEVLTSKKALKDTEKLRLANNYLEIGENKKAIKYLKNIVKNGKNRDIILKALIKLKDLSEKLNINVEDEIIFKHLNIIIKKRNKKIVDLYNIGSAYKRLKKYNNSKKWFKKVIKITDNNTLKAGAYFHLGEIEFTLGNKKKALTYFKKCLELNPEHKKAKEYIEKLKHEKEQ